MAVIGSDCRWAYDRDVARFNYIDMRHLLNCPASDQIVWFAPAVCKNSENSQTQLLTRFHGEDEV